jgi:O-antigen/teichoic acid export membrane protein
MVGLPSLNSSKKVLVAYNTSSQFIGKIATAGATFLVSLIIARNYGASGFGNFIKITTFVTLFYLFVDFGLNAIYLRQSAENENNNYFPTLFTFRLTSSIILTFIAISVLAFLPSNGQDGYTSFVKLGIILYSPTIIFQALITSTNAIFQKQLRYDLSTIAVTIGTMISLLFVYLSSKIFLPNIALSPIIISLGLGSAISAIIAIFYAKRWNSISFKWDSKQIKALFLTALPLGLTLLCNVVYFRSDSFILTFYRTTAEVGLYGFAYKIFEFPLVIPTFFMNAVYPLMVRAKTNQEILRLAKRSLLFLVPTSIMLTLVFWYFAPLLNFIKPEFNQSINILRILALGLPLFFLSSLTMWLLITQKKQGMLLIIYAISMVINIGANLIYIPVYGIAAAAWITVLSEAFVLMVSLFTINSSFKNSSVKV